MDTSIPIGNSCPISGTKVNAAAARINGLVVTAVLAVALFTPYVWVLAFLICDFAIKVFVGFKYSPICALSRTLAKALRLPAKMVDVAPKRFAAGLGLGFSTAGLVLGVAMTAPLAYYLVVGMFAVCAALEGFAGFCVGCTIYQVIAGRRPSMKR